jgi:hypothetical protein
MFESFSWSAAHCVDTKVSGCVYSDMSFPLVIRLNRTENGPKIKNPPASLSGGGFEVAS